MKKILVTLAIVALAPVLVAPAAEAGNFSVGVAFNVGGLFFDLGFGGPRYSAHAGHHVYRVSEPFHYRGYPCHSGCYRSGGYGYHHADCPAVAYHFRSHGFSPYASYPSHLAPRADGHYAGPYVSHYTGRYGGHYSGHDGYYSHDSRGTYGSRYSRRYDHHRYDRTRERSRYGTRHYRDYRHQRHHHDNRRDHYRDHRSRHDYRDGRDRRHHNGHGGEYRGYRTDRHRR